MKVEIAFAIILGVILGVAGMFGVATLLNRHIPQKQTKVVAVASPTPSTQEDGLLIPKNNSSWDGSKIAIAGVAHTPFVFLSSNTGDFTIPTRANQYSVQSSTSTGALSFSVFLPSGAKTGTANVLSYAGLPKEGQLFEGSVTDITHNGLQMKEAGGTLEQVTFSPNPVLVSFVKDTKKIEESDIAIGDAVIVEGTRNENTVILANGVFVMNADFVFPEFKLTTGPLSKFVRNSFTITTDGADQTFQTGPGTKLFGIKADGTTRTRTKLIAGDSNSTLYIVQVASASATPARSVFISE